MADGDSGPLVSVVIPTYDRETYLRTAVESALLQTYDPLEVVVVDDHSPVPAREVLDTILTDHGDRVEVIRHEENRGGSAARNTALDAADGDLIAFLDDDDLFVETKLATQVAALERSGADAIYGASYNVKDETVEIVEPTGPPEGDVTKSLLLGNYLPSPLSNLLVTADAVVATGQFDEAFPSLQDTEWLVRLSRNATFDQIDDPVVIRRLRLPGAEHDRLGTDRRTTMEVAYPMFVEKFRSVAAEYGRSFERRFLAHTHYKLLRHHIGTGNTRAARRHLLKTVYYDPPATRALRYVPRVFAGKRLNRVLRTVARTFRSDDKTDTATEPAPGSLTLAELRERHEAASLVVPSGD